jgi:putative nucleotidyltransferase with HDIG domain
MNRAQAFIEDARELPVMPPVAAEVMRKAEDPDTAVKEIAELISRDAALAVRVLKIANSSFYAMAREVQTMQQAIMLLGYSTLRSVVVAASMKDVFAHFGLAERLLWEHAVAAAVAANRLAREVGGMNPDELFLAGLLHDVGRLVMYSQDARRYQEVLKAIYAEGGDPIALERKHFGFDHCEVGRLLLEKWRLPARLGAAVGGHHDPDSVAGTAGEKPLAALLQVVDRICLREGMGRRKPEPELDVLACAGARILNLAELDVSAFCQAFREAYEQEKAVFG